MWSDERSGCKNKLPMYLGFGDENSFLPRVWANEHKGMHLTEAKQSLAKAKGYMLYGLTKEAVNQYKGALLETVSDDEFDRIDMSKTHT